MKTFRKRIFGREIHLSIFPRYKRRKPYLKLRLMPSYYANNRIFELTVFAKSYRVNWTPQR